MARLAFDVETNGFLRDLTEIHCLEIEDIDTGAVTRCADQPGFVPVAAGVRMLMEAEEIVGHNIIPFDIPAIKKVYPWFMPKGRIRDTLVMARLLWADLGTSDQPRAKRGALPSKLVGSHSLKAWGYRLGVLKGDFSEDADWSFWTPEMQDYCRQDVVVTVRLVALIDKQNAPETAVDLEHRFATVMALMVANGFTFDRPAAEALYAILVKERLKIEEELQVAFPPITREHTEISKVSNKKSGRVKGQPYTKVTVETFNPGSRQQIARRLKELGWEPQEFTETGLEKIDEKILSKLEYPQAKLLGRWFMLAKRLGQLAEGEAGWLRLEVNGRIHGSINTNGAVTGRCTHSSPNMAQVPSERAEFGRECRALFRARKGWKLVGADLAGIELRCLAHFMARYDGGAYVKVLLEGDVHWSNAIALGLVPEGTERDSHDPHHIWARGVAKTFISMG